MVGLAWPVIGENLLETMLGIVDTYLVAGLGAAAVAGVGSGLQIMFFVLSALSALSIGSSILVAQAVGAKDTASASRLGRQSLLWSGLLSVPLAAAGYFFSHPLIRLFHLAPDVSKIGADYLQVTMATVVVLVALIIGGGVLRGAGDTRTPLVVTAIANVVNIALAYGLIYGHWGLPHLGAVGSAWATFISRTIALALLLVVLWQGRNGVRVGGGGSWYPAWTVVKNVVRLGVPASLEQLIAATAFLFLTVLVARLGTDTLAAQRISMTALSFSFLPGFGFGTAATTLVGQSVGARRIRVGAAAAQIATVAAVFWMSAIGIVAFVFARPIMAQFTSDAEVIRIGAEGLRVVALSQPFWAVGIVLSGALRGAGDTRSPLFIGSSGIWAAVGLVWVFLTYFHGGLAAVWIAFLITSPVSALLTWLRFNVRLREVETDLIGTSETT